MTPLVGVCTAQTPAQITIHKKKLFCCGNGKFGFLQGANLLLSDTVWTDFFVILFTSLLLTILITNDSSNIAINSSSKIFEISSFLYFRWIGLMHSCWNSHGLCTWYGACGCFIKEAKALFHWTYIFVTRFMLTVSIHLPLFWRTQISYISPLSSNSFNFNRGFVAAALK